MHVHHVQMRMECKCYEDCTCELVNEALLAWLENGSVHTMSAKSLGVLPVI